MAAREKTTAHGGTLSPGAVLLLGTLLPCLILTGIYRSLEIWPFGAQAILEVDGVHQYLPFLTELRRKLLTGDSLFYSFSGGLGYNFWATIAYYAASPLNLLLPLVPEAQVIDFMDWATVLKLGLSGGATAWTLYRRQRRGAAPALALGTMFALSNFLLGYKFNIMWLDPIALAPLLMAGLEGLAEEGRCRLYLLSLFFALWCNYYIGYMLCLFSVLYFFCLWLTGPREGRGRRLGRFFLASLAAGGMAAVLLLPAFLSLRLSTSGSGAAGPGLRFYTDPLRLLRAHAPDILAFRTSYQRGDAQLYCGLAALPLAGLYFVQPRVPGRRRLVMGCLLAFFLLSFCFSPLNYVWHGFHLETGLPNRFAFLYVLLLLRLGHEALCRLEELPPARLLAALGGALLLLCLLLWRELPGDRSLLPSLGLLAAYGLLLAGLRFWGRRPWLLLLLCLLLTGEAADHARRDLEAAGGDPRSYYQSYQRDAQALLSSVEDGSFARMDIDSDSMINFATYVGGHGVALFHSGMQAGVQDLFESLHVYTHLNTVWYRGVSKPVKDLFGQRWLISTRVTGESWNGLSRRGTENGKVLYENPDALPLGCLVSSEILDWDPAAGTGMEAENSFFRLAVGCPQLFREELYFFGHSGQRYQFPLPQGCLYYILLDEAPPSLRWETPEYSLRCDKRTEFILEAAATGPDQAAVLSVESWYGRDYTGHSYTCDLAEYARALDLMRESPLTQVEARGRRVSGRIEAARDGVLLLTLPYDRGWRAEVDGAPAELRTVGGALLGLPMTAGSHTVSLRYTPPGFVAGAVLSLLSLGLCLWLLRGEKRNTTKKRRGAL